MAAPAKTDADQKAPPPSEVGIAIAGGGLGGLALAVGLLERGFDVHVFEAAQELRTGSGTIIGLAANANTALDGLKPGLHQAIRDVGSVSKEMVFYRLRNGEVVETKEAKDMGATGVMVVRWQSVQNILATLVPPERVHCGLRLSAYESVEEGVNAVFDVVGASAEHHYTHRNEQAACGQRTVRAKLLVGADGIRSAVRRILAGDAPRYVRHLNWNAVVPREFVPGLSKDTLHRTEDDVTGLITFKADAGHGYSFWQVRVRDTDCRLADSLGPTWGGLGKPGAKQRALEHLEELGEAYDAVRSAIESTPEADIFERRLMANGPIDTWLDADDRLVLLGDAAHAMHPGPGEGARQAFEDAHQLCLALVDEGAAALDRAAVGRALKRYELLRKHRCETVQAMALEGSGLPPEETVPPEFRDFTREQKNDRFKEFASWLQTYPDNPVGDPNSRFFKPPAELEEIT
ncbi:zeaxanthin epoxidase [Klebsormidium nitens]|uniref:Zeaxanthin epoxidase n=1 Tax=Klebsormidium nitens TaxID=105231 RepID=A0A0U9HUF8_KLENI|nr:zeaxanthin epoxidase [Klebsormidium nitens]|eukprot:GAQ81821.1 zeaxanthin epoxidase [Klebsormidium nitens]